MADIEKLKALAEAQPVKEWSRREAGMSSYARKPMFVVDGPEAVSDYESWGFTRAAASYIEAASPAAVLELIAEVERLRHVSAWVSVEERLPESGAPVLVWCDGCGRAGVAWIRQGAWLMPEPQPLGYESITHWMPLPAGPTATESRP